MDTARACGAEAKRRKAQRSIGLYSFAPIFASSRDFLACVLDILKGVFS
jgi:hypothetical protein